MCRSVTIERHAPGVRGESRLRRYRPAKPLKSVGWERHAPLVLVLSRAKCLEQFVSSPAYGASDTSDGLQGVEDQLTVPVLCACSDGPENADRNERALATEDPSIFAGLFGPATPGFAVVLRHDRYRLEQVKKRV